MNIGRAIPFRQAQLEQLAQMTTLDIETARAFFEGSTSPRYRSLLTSSLRQASVTAVTPYVWDPRIGQYRRTSTGRPISPLEIRTAAIEPVILRSRQIQRTLSSQLQAREISLAEWQTQMITQIKQTQLAAALAANGGEKNTNDNDKEEIALLLLALLLLFQGFAEQIERQQQPLNGMLLVRSDLYASAARGVFEDVGTYVARVYLGRTEERRVLGVAEHCHTVRTRAESILGTSTLEGCVELAEKGWQPIGSLPRIGQSPCRTNCRCHKEYR